MEDGMIDRSTRRRRLARSSLVARLCLLAALLVNGGALWLADAWPALASSFAVTNTNDSGPGSLRQAIWAANAHPNAAQTPDVITFAIPQAQCTTNGIVCTISPTSPRPTITDPVVVDGRSQGGPTYKSRPLVELDGSRAGEGANGLTITAGHSTVKGLIINRFAGNGITIRDGGHNHILGNQLGTDADGSTARGNRTAGISISHSEYNMIGVFESPTPDDRNVISGNLIGIALENRADFTRVFNNLIGTDRLGTAALGNATYGISIVDSGVSLIGHAWYYEQSPLPNVIAFNGQGGIVVLSGYNNMLGGNRIFGNGGLGIDLGLNGPTPNDPLDADEGPNALQNYPVLTSARPVDGGAVVAGFLNGRPGHQHDVYFYASPACDPSGFGEGQTLILLNNGYGFAHVDTDEQGTRTFAVTLPGVAAGQSITATAADSEDHPAGAATSTSEFSACRTVAPVMPGITISPRGPLLTSEAGGTATVPVVLQVPPAANVTIPLVSANPREGTVTPPALTFTPQNWNVPQTITITGVDDKEREGDQPFTIKVGPTTSADSGYNNLDPDDLSVTNVDDDGGPVLWIEDVSVFEGDAGMTAMIFTVTLSSPSRDEVAVTAEAAGGTATPDSDFTPAKERLTFKPGETTKQVKVAVVGDTSAEPDETLVLRLFDPQNALLPRTEASGTIRNDDAR
jgi:hypothetical protein